MPRERRHERVGIGRRPHHQRDGRLVVLRERQVEVRPRLLAEHQVLAVGDDADHLRPVACRPPTRKRWPTASFPGQSFFAMVSLTSPTRAIAAVSVPSSARPLISRPPVVSRNRGPTTL